MPLNRDQILASTDLPVREVDVPEWGGSLLIKMLNVRERLAFEERAGSGEFGQKGIMLEIVIAACVDEEFRPIFTAEDAAELATKNPDVVLRVAMEALAVNRMGKSDVDELAKNSAASPSDGSSSASRHLSG